MKVDFLRKRYPRFIYQKYSWKISQRNLEIFFNFKIESNDQKEVIQFKPKIKIKNIKRFQIKKVGQEILNNLIFHLGLVEIPSYWKLTSSPEIIIKAGFLDKQQIDWWKDLIFKGMGQFFYENKIDFRKPNFLKIQSRNFRQFQAMASIRRRCNLNKKRFLIPVGGGKDSIVTLEKLKKQEKEIGCFLVNPTPAMRKIVKVAGIKDSVIVRRKIDPTLLELNKKGFLNGHIPITAVYSFLSVLAAVLFNYKHITFSNEKSADEGNVRYLGKMINHQWSKSSEFEKKFRFYCQKYLVKDINYFSFLRKYNELEIAKMFTQYPQYFSVFSSCNLVLRDRRGTVPQRWCGNCPKCLFVYATLYPFLEKKQLLKIFGRDIFENKKLLPAMKGLIDPELAKPFECLGTKRESLFSFYLCQKKSNSSLPYLLRYFKNKILTKYPQLEKTLFRHALVKQFN